MTADHTCFAVWNKHSPLSYNHAWHISPHEICQHWSQHLGPRPWPTGVNMRILERESMGGHLRFRSSTQKKRQVGWLSLWCLTMKGSLQMPDMTGHEIKADHFATSECYVKHPELTTVAKVQKITQRLLWFFGFLRA